ncbi:MAG: translation initiation factor IF-2 [Patescibacteria group bacterium]
MTKSNTIARPPVVVVMGHIDHGKSTLLDYIQKSNVVESETGGITQHVAAYEVVLDGKKITFIDTPGHDAFTGIRERGAAMADVAILVVSAEDGVKPQTIEAWQAITANKLPYLVAINKIDRPNANLERTKQSLAENNIFLEGYGGDIPFTPISAKTGEGVKDLLELINLQAELLALTGDPNAPATGFVLEASLDARAGTGATIIIKNGTLHQRDFLLIDQDLFRLKRLNNFLGQPAASLSFSAPALIAGCTELPKVGQAFFAFADKKTAETKLEEIRQGSPLPHSQGRPLPAQTEKEVIIPLIIKADVAGSLEAVEKELSKIIDDKVGLKIINQGTGQITENDIKTALASKNSLVLGFRVKTERAAEQLAEQAGLPIQTFDIIYKLSEWLTAEVQKRRPKITVEEVVGQAKILKIFNQDKGKQVVGGSVLEGVVSVGQSLKIMRRGAELGQGKITNLEQQKNKVKTVETGNQFGALVEAKIALAPGDVLEAIELVVK